MNERSVGEFPTSRQSSTQATAALRPSGWSTRREAYDIARAKGATNYGISAALTRITKAILRDERAVLAVSTLVPGTMHLGEVSLSVLAFVGREGIRGFAPLQLSDEEQAAMKRSAEVVKRHIATLEL